MIGNMMRDVSVKRRMGSIFSGLPNLAMNDGVSQIQPRELHFDETEEGNDDIYDAHSSINETNPILGEYRQNHNPPEAPPQLNHQNSHGTREYEALIPVTPYGLLLRFNTNERGRTEFTGYNRAPNGTMGPSENQHLVRNIGDTIQSINGIDTVSSTQMICNRNLY